MEILQGIHKLRSENGHEPESFPDKIIFTSMFNDITDYGRGKSLDSEKEVATYAARFSPGYGCFCGPGSGQTWKDNESRPAAQFAKGEWNKPALKMMSELTTSKHPVFKCSSLLQTRILTSKKEKPGAHFAENNVMLVHTVLACNQLCLFFAVQRWIQHKIPVQLPITNNDLNQEEVTATAHHRPQVCAVGEHVPYHEQSFRAVGGHLLRCNPSVCAVGDRVLPESKKEQATKPFETTQQELVVKASGGARV